MYNSNLIDKQLQELIDKSGKINISLSQKQILEFEIYLNKLIQWNKRINLISKNDIQRVVSNHFLVSLAILNVIQLPPNCKVIDVGTGAGLPGVPLKIARPDLNITLLDSKRMKIIFVRDVVNTINLPEVDFCHERAEIACTQKDFHRNFDYVITRAVSNLLNIYEWTNQFLKNEGEILAFKGNNNEQEISELLDTHSKLNIEQIPLKFLNDLENKKSTIIRIH